MALSILPTTINDHGYTISYSRTCAQYKIITENGRPKVSLLQINSYDKLQGKMQIIAQDKPH